MFLYKYIKGPPSGDIIQNSIGAWGKYQLWICFLIFMNKLPMGWIQMSIIFLAPPVKYTCGGAMVRDDDVLPPPGGGVSAWNVCPCKNPIYDKSIFTSTIITEWNLICERKHLAASSQMIIQGGTLIGSIIFGMASDRYGRRPPLIAAVILQAGAGIAASFAPSLWLFNVFRFGMGASVGGVMVAGFVLLMEFIGVNHRPPVSALYQVPLNIGHLTLPLISYYVRDFRKYHLAITAPILLLSLYYCLLPETPRWLLAVKKNEEAIAILTKVAKINKLPTADIRSNVLAHQAAADQSGLKKGTVLDLFKTPNLRKRILAMAYQWFTCSFCFYGVSQYISHLTGDIFTNVAISAALILSGTLITVPLIQIMKRKPMMLIFQGLCSLCFFILTAIPSGAGSIVFASIGVVAAFMVFILVYLYSSELFPTVVRTAALGFASMIARIGSMMAPYVIDTKDFAVWMPPVIFAIVPAIAVLVGCLLPETKGHELMTTIQEGEAFGQKQVARK